MNDRKTYRSLLVFLLSLTRLAPADGQTVTNAKQTANSITGVGFHSGYGLFSFPSPDILPKGKFAAGGSYNENADGSGASAFVYSVGIGLATRLEGYLASTQLMKGGIHDLLQGSLKLNFLRGGLGEDFLSSIEVGYVKRNDEEALSVQSGEVLLSRLHGRILAGDFEVISHLGYAVRLGGDPYAARSLIGVGTLVPVARNVTVGAELGSGLESAASGTLMLNIGAKAALVDHFQILLALQTAWTGNRVKRGVSLGITFSSAMFLISPGRQQTSGGIPPLPSLEELSRLEESKKN